MVAWRVVCANSTTVPFSEGITAFAPPWGGLIPTALENQVQMRTRQDGGHTYTLANLFVRVAANNTDNPSTIRSRRNALDGNQSVSFPANTSGVAEDTVNTDSVADGDRINSEMTVGAGAPGDALVLSIISYTLTDNATAPQNFAGTGGGAILDAALAVALSVNGQGGAVLLALEAKAAYRIRVPMTAEKLRVFIGVNSVDGGTTFDFRLAPADTALDLVIPALTSGEFEETVTAVSVASGDFITHGMVTAGTMGFMTVAVTQVRLNSTVRHLASHNASGTSASQRPFGITCFGALEEGGQGGGGGDPRFWNLTESIAEITPRIAMEMTNLFVTIFLNDLDNTTTVALRVNGSNSLVSVSFPASTTGFFEDLADLIPIMATDTVNYLLDTSLSGSGNITLLTCGAATLQRPRGRTGVALGLIVRNRVN